MKVQFIDNQEEKLSNLLATEIRTSQTTRMAVAFVSASGLALIKEPVLEALSRANQIEILVGLDFVTTEPDALRTMLEWSEQFSSFAFYCLIPQGSVIYHPKMYMMTDGVNAAVCVGSSNLTAGGLMRNAEANIFINGDANSPVIVDALESYVRLKFDKRVTPDKELVNLYGELSEAMRKPKRILRETAYGEIQEKFAEKVKSLSRPIPTKQDLVGWLKLVYEALPQGEFTNEDAYAYEEQFRAMYPNNQNIVPKIRQQLQFLRDMNLIEHVSRGNWQKKEQP